MMRLLLVEDEPEMADMLSSALVRHDLVVDHAPTLAIAREAILGAGYDAVVLDRLLPDGDGIGLIPEIRKACAGVPVIVLSALGSVAQRIEGLDTGADDYLSKPFSVDELLARIRALRRRPAAVAAPAVTLGNLVFDLDSREAAVAGRPLDLPRRERLVLAALMRRAGRSVSRAALEEAVFGYDDEIASNALDAHVSRLRRKLEATGAAVEIHAIRGIGYLIRQRA